MVRTGHQDNLREAPWWTGNPKSFGYKAAAYALEKSWLVKPLFVREGGTTAVSTFFQETLKTEVIHIPIASDEDQQHLENERISLENLMKGKSTLMNFFEYVETRFNK